MKLARSLRCAIYTRKSSEEGLEQAFNSLHAQREACEAYIKSQQHEGWRLIKTAYDDGGFSGGTMERPNLKQLLHDIRSGLIDIVVVYKVDRLTRSLTDFARIVETFEAHQVSFVSVTQAFNTTSSMGRLTLNVLLSFAQFEREVTGERIRDKIAASRSKGIWMGGYPPLGYDVRKRKLEINAVEAQQVRAIFERYLALGSVRLLMEELKGKGLKSKHWTTAKGTVRGGSTLCRGALYTILKNRVYLGETVHKGKLYPGEHEAIIPEDLWQQVEALLANQRRKHHGNRLAMGHLLTGLVFDDRGHPMVPTHTSKGRDKRYRYYTSRGLIAGHEDDPGSLPRVAAPAIEEVVLGAFKRELPAAESKAFHQADGANRWKLLRHHVRRVTLARNQVAIEFAKEGIRVEIPICLKTRGGETLIVTPLGPSTGPRVDATLVKTFSRAWNWRLSLERGRVRSAVELARADGCTVRYVTRILRLAYLAPDIIEAILAGRQPCELTLARLLKIDLPLDWHAQREALGF
jgi:site-specific DNA recombinase